MRRTGYWCSRCESRESPAMLPLEQASVMLPQRRSASICGITAGSRALSDQMPAELGSLQMAYLPIAALGAAYGVSRNACAWNY